MQEAFGIDIGRVIINGVNDNTDTLFFGDNYLRTKEVPDAAEVIREPVEKRFGEQVYLISRCGKKRARTLHWLAHHRFHQRSGVLSSHVRFCRERHEKAAICEELGITHFADDRLEVLSRLTMVGKLFLFQPRPEEVRRFAEHLPRVQQVNSWREIRKELLP